MKEEMTDNGAQNGKNGQVVKLNNDTALKTPLYLNRIGLCRHYRLSIAQTQMVLLMGEGEFVLRRFIIQCQTGNCRRNGGVTFS